MVDWSVAVVDTGDNTEQQRTVYGMRMRAMETNNDWMYKISFCIVQQTMTMITITVFHKEMSHLVTETVSSTYADER